MSIRWLVWSLHSNVRKFEVIKHSPKSINQWIANLHKQHEGQIAIAIELSKGPIVYGSIHDYGKKIETDLCQQCFADMCGDTLRVTEETDSFTDDSCVL